MGGPSLDQAQGGSGAAYSQDPGCSLKPEGGRGRIGVLDATKEVGVLSRRERCRWMGPLGNRVGQIINP